MARRTDKSRTLKNNLNGSKSGRYIGVCVQI